MTRPKNVVNEQDLAWAELRHGERYEVRRKQLAQAAGAQQLGASLFELPPGKKGWPLHAHLANEEAIYVLAGRGVLRLGADEVPVGPGDYVALPAGPELPRQMLNPFDAPVRYLALSTMREPDVMLYPDSGKLGVVAGAAPGGPKQARTFGGFWAQDQSVDYWKDED